MKTGAVCHYQKCWPGTTIASARISQMLARRYDFDLIDDVASAEAARGRKYDYVIVVSSAPGFADQELRVIVGELTADAGCYLYAQNDYISAPGTGQISAAHRDRGKDPHLVVWSTIPSVAEGYKWARKESRYVNWNMLTWTPERRRGDPLAVAGGLAYYGAHRRDRVPYFERWLKDADYPVTISTSTRVAGKWRATVGERPRVLGPMSDAVAEMRDLGGCALYAEDQASHRRYMSPANRWYEMLSAAMPIVVEPSALGTLAEAGYRREDLRRWSVGLVEAPRVLVERVLADPEAVAAEQATLWARDYRAELEEQLAAAERLVGLAPVQAGLGLAA